MGGYLVAIDRGSQLARACHKNLTKTRRSSSGYGTEFPLGYSPKKRSTIETPKGNAHKLHKAELTASSLSTAIDTKSTTTMLELGFEPSTIHIEQTSELRTNKHGDVPSPTERSSNSKDTLRPHSSPTVVGSLGFFKPQRNPNLPHRSYCVYSTSNTSVSSSGYTGSMTNRSTSIIRTSLSQTSSTSSYASLNSSCSSSDRSSISSGISNA